MRKHLAARLVWHDNSWGGCVCRNPKLRASCVVRRHIREDRDDERHWGFGVSGFGVGTHGINSVAETGAPVAGRRR